MIDFWMQYGLFLTKTATLLIGVLLFISGLIALSQKNRVEEGALIITNINEKLDEIRSHFQNKTLTKTAWKKWFKAAKNQKKDKNLFIEAHQNARTFVIRFEGDLRPTQLKPLRESVTAIIEVANPQADEVLIILESAGGFVQGYGLAASQLQRLRQHKLSLTVAIDKCAASGGYMMACVANKILAAPFAIVGSIGVIAQLPNFHRWLNKHDIDIELHTAGEYKRTLTVFGENTRKGRVKFQQEIEETHNLFKKHIIHHRPQLNIEEVATGEHWHGIDALKLNLIDELTTSDDYILAKTKTSQVFEISYRTKQRLSNKLFGAFSHISQSLVGNIKKFLISKIG